MKVTPDPSWTLTEAYEAAWKAYSGIGLASRGYRNSVLMAWGSVVGRERAMSELKALVAMHGSKKAFAESLEISPSSLRKIEKYFQSLPPPFDASMMPLSIKMIVGCQLTLEEPRQNVEFKEVRGNNPVRSISNVAEEYAVGFLNGNGGRILWGIRDNGEVIGVNATRQQRDEINRQVRNKLQNIKPPVDPSLFTVVFHPVFSGDKGEEDLIVVEVVVPKSIGNTAYFTGSDKMYVNLKGVNQKLSGPQIQEWIERRMQN